MTLRRTLRWIIAAVLIVPLGYCTSIGGAADGGTEHVSAAATYALAVNVENLTLTGTAAIDGTGNAGNNVVTGNSAANALDGGAGGDAIAGGFGGDMYRFGRGYGQDTIQEVDGGSDPIDTVQFAADTAPADVAVTRTATDLILTISGTADVLAVARVLHLAGCGAMEVRKCRPPPRQMSIVEDESHKWSYSTPLP